MLRNNYGRAQEIQYLFIDGAYFRQATEDVITRYFPGELPDIDFAKINSGFRKVFYYDCLAPQKNGESITDYETRINPQVALFNSIRALPGFHVKEGQIRREGKKNTQKGVDIAIAVDMLTHSMHRNMDRATLLTGDLDFKPLIDALVQDGMYITLWYEKLSTNPELFYSADSRQILDLDSIWNMSSLEFQRQLQNPHACFYSSNDDQTKGLSIYKKGVTSEGEELVIFTDGKCYKLKTKMHSNPEHILVISHSSCEILEKYMKDNL